MSHPASASQCAARSRQAWMATKMFRVTTSRAVRSAMKASTDAGSTARTRAVASRTAAIFAARSALSTTGGSGAQDPFGTPLLDGLEVEVVEQRPRLAGDQGTVVPLDEQLPVAEDAVRERRGRLVEEHQVNGASDGGFQSRGKAAERAHVPRGAGAERDGNVGVAPCVRCAPDAGAEEQRVGDVRFSFEDAAKRSQHAARLARDGACGGYCCPRSPPASHAASRAARKVRSRALSARASARRYSTAASVHRPSRRRKSARAAGKR